MYCWGCCRVRISLSYTGNHIPYDFDFEVLPLCHVILSRTATWYFHFSFVFIYMYVCMCSYYMISITCITRTYVRTYVCVCVCVCDNLAVASCCWTKLKTNKPIGRARIWVHSKDKGAIDLGQMRLLFCRPSKNTSGLQFVGCDMTRAWRIELKTIIPTAFIPTLCLQTAVLSHCGFAVGTTERRQPTCCICT